MKKLTLLLLFALGFTIIKAQDCTGFFPMKKGVEIEMTFYDKKGAVSSISKQKITDVKKLGEVYNITIQNITRDDKGKEMSDLTMTASCENGNFQMELSEMMDQTTRESLDNMEFKLEGDKLSLPNKLSVGQKLPDAKMTMSTDGALKLNATFTIEDRQVISKESITVPAGTYECYLITYSQNLKMLTGSENTIKQWVNPEVGLVQVETYNAKGKLTGSQKLTSISIP